MRHHASVAALLNDKCLLEYVYAVLPAWGMHRMGEQAAKVGEFPDMVPHYVLRNQTWRSCPHR